MSTWHILKVFPCAEFRVRDDLHDIKWPAFVPVEFAMRKVRRKDGTTSVQRKPIVPGYVFARVSSWATLRDVKGYREPLRIGDRPAVIGQSTMDAVEMLSKPLKSMARSHGWSVGEAIRIKRGLVAEVRATIQALESKGAVVAYEMFGREQRQRIPYEQLHPHG